MATFYVDIPKIEQEETTKTACLDLDENSNNDVEVGLDATSNNDVKVNIAIAGKAGSGRSSFVNAILGLEENDKTATEGERVETKSKGKESTSYSHPKNPNINFSILPNMDSKTSTAFDRYLESIEIERFDAFLIFTAEDFTKKHVRIAKKIKPSNKPFFFIRTKLYNDNHPEDFNKEAMLKMLRASLDEHSKELNCREYETHLISNLHPYKWDFLKLTKAIADAFPSPQKVSFSKIPKIEELIAWEKFQNFLKEVEEREKNVTKTLPSMDEITRLFVGSGIVGVQRMMNQKLDRWKEVTINLAILGESGVGKSSFVNAIREVGDGDENAAGTDIVESTLVPTRYEHPTNPNIRFWDLPGVGTPKFCDIAVFCEKVAIEKYDTFLIICAKRFTENDLKLAKKIESMKKSFFFVRTKIDSDKKAEMKRLQEKFDEEKMLKKIRDDCAKNLKDFDFSEEKIFLISSWKQHKWDFERLKKAVLDQLPSKQKESLAFSMRTHSEDILSEKIEILKGRVWTVAAASVASKLTLGPVGYLVDVKLIRDKVRFYSKQLEFPDIDSDEYSVLSGDLQKKLEKFYPKPNSQDHLEWLQSFDSNNTFNIKMFGKMITTKKPLVFVYRFLNLVLDEMEETALAILCEAAVREGDVPDDLSESSDSD